MKLKIGEKIKALRREQDMTQEELAEQLGVTYQSVSRWETCTCYPDLELLPVIAGADSVWYAMVITELLVAVYGAYHMIKTTRTL